MCCSVLQCVAVCCSVLQCVAVCCSTYENGRVDGMDTFYIQMFRFHKLQAPVVCCSVLQCVAVCCSVLQCNCRHLYYGVRVYGLVFRV